MAGVCRDCNTVLPPRTLWSTKPVDDKITSKVRNASRNGHQGCIRALLDSGADVNADCFLVESAGGGHLECLQLLLAVGADINRRHNDSGVTALHAAAQKGQESTLEELLRVGADVNARDRDCEETPLIAAAHSGQNSCARILIRADADVDAQDYKEYNALYHAAYFDQSETVKILIEAGADVNQGDRRGNNIALHKAIDQGAVESLKLMLEAGADVNGYTTGAGVNKSKTDVNNANEDEEKSVNTGADVNKGNVNRWDRVNSTSVDEEGGVNDVNTDKKTADSHNEEDLSGSDSNQSCLKEPYQPLISAIQAGQRECALVLIAAGADVNNVHVCTPIVLASEMGYTDVVKALIQNGADVNSVNEACAILSEEESAIIKAVANGHYACAELLTAAGADVNSHWEGLTPLFVSSGHTANVRCAKLLLRAGARVNEPMRKEDAMWPVTHPDTRKIARLLLAAGETLEGTPGELWIADCQETLKEMNLKNFCRNEIRRCLIARDRHSHLFGRIPLLKLPKQIERFLLYEFSLEDDE